MKSKSYILSELEKCIYLNKVDILITLNNFNPKTVISKNAGILIRSVDNKLYMYCLGLDDQMIFTIDQRFLLILYYFKKYIKIENISLLVDSSYNFISNLMENVRSSSFNMILYSLISILCDEENLEFIKQVRKVINDELGIIISPTVVEITYDANFY